MKTMESRYDDQFKTVFDVLRQIVHEEEKPSRRIGFHSSEA